MSFTIYDASVPVFVSTLTNMRAWLDKAAGEKATRRRWSRRAWSRT